MTAPQTGAGQAVAGSYLDAARFGLPDTVPREALLAARVGRGVPPRRLEAPASGQTHGPRQAVHVLPEPAWTAFTVGRLPCDRDAVRALRPSPPAPPAQVTWQWRQQRTSRIPCVTGGLVIHWDAGRLTAGR